MPVSRNTSSNGDTTHAPTPGDPNLGLRAYRFHGVDLTVRGNHGVGDCPFCGKEGKFSVDVETTEWRCWVCGGGRPTGGGNAMVFLRLLHEQSQAITPRDSFSAVGADRKLLSDNTLVAWGMYVARDRTWVVPGYGADGEVKQLYRRQFIDGGWRLLPTPGVHSEGKVHHAHLPSADFDLNRPNVVVCEGPWDGMALWEVSQGEFGDASIVAVPGCNVWRDEWTAMCRGKCVTLLYDSDHPITRLGRPVRAGWDGMQRVARMLHGTAAAIRVVRWGPDGYDPSKPTGWDVRDDLAAAGDSLAARRRALAGLVSKVEDAPRDWFSAVPSTNGSHRGSGTEARDCSSWLTCDGAWRGALRWREDLADALAVLLAVCASTRQAGNQLFLDLIGSPGSAKTTLCRGLLTSTNCVHLENATKLISGYKMADDPTKDCSFLARANGKTWVTCEFDVLLNSPQYPELMGKIRRIFDGETSSTYANTDEDRIYRALRTPWIRAGTQRMMDHDQSQLGDRFLRFILIDPANGERREIARSAARLERAAMTGTANGVSGSIEDPKTRLAHELTGGYVDWLREHVENELSKVVTDDFAEDRCIDLAELSADLRARPIGDDRKKYVQDTHDCKEMPTRLARQNIRLAACLAVVLNRRSVDRDVLRIVRRVAMDTATGNSLRIVQWMCSVNPQDPTRRTFQESGGIPLETMSVWCSLTSERMSKYLQFLKKMDVTVWTPGKMTNGAWTLTDRVYDLYLRVMGD